MAGCGVAPLRSYRETWVFPFTVEELRAAANLRVKHHEERKAHWVTKVAELEEKVRTEGIDFNPRVRAGQMSNTAYHNRPTLDDELLSALSDAQERVRFHEDHREEMAGYLSAFFNVEPETKLNLTVEDVGFFYL